MLGGPQNRSEQRGDRKILPLLELELRPLGGPARSQWPYRMRCPGCPCYDKEMKNSSLLEKAQLSELYDRTDLNKVSRILRLVSNGKYSGLLCFLNQ
jgi:hypothetical protein